MRETAPEELLRWAADAGDALAEWHDRHGVHGQLCPAAFVDLDRGVRLVRPAQAGPGLFRYASPEHSGRLSRDVDERSDLYSFGAVLYERATGDTPVPAATPAGLARRQLTTAPPPRLPNGQPRMLAEILAGLLTALPEEGYQTAQALASDLRRCLEEYRAHGPGASFLLGTRDVPQRLLPTGRLHGRQSRLARLTAALDRVATTGAVELVSVTGESGLGKSALLGQFVDGLVRAGGRGARTTFDPHDGAPYAAVARLLSDLTEQLLMESDGRAEHWHGPLRAALGESVDVLVTIVPAIAPLLDVPAPPGTDLSAEQPAVSDERLAVRGNRLPLAVHRLIRAVAMPGRPLVLALDDLHHADPTSVALLRHVLGDPHTGHLLVVAAYRPREIGADLADLLRDRPTDRGANTVALRPLPDAALAELLADMLRAGRREASELARAVADRTGSNPLAVLEFLQQLRDERVLNYDPRGPVWRWDLRRVRAAEAIDDLPEALRRRAAALPSRTLHLLRGASVLGERFDAPTLARCAGYSVSEVTERLRPAVQARLLRMTAEPGGGFSYRWSHELARRTIRDGLPEAQARALRLAAGRSIVHNPVEQPAHAIHLAVAHLICAFALTSAESERERLIRLCVAAGRREYTLGLDGRERLLMAYDLLLPDAWERTPELAYRVQLAAAEAAGAGGDRGHAEILADRLLSHLDDPPRRARVFAARARWRVAAGDQTGAALAAQQALGCLGFAALVPPGAARWPAAARKALVRLRTKLRGVTIDGYLAGQVGTDTAAGFAGDLIADLLAPRWGYPHWSAAGAVSADWSTLLAAVGVELAIETGPRPSGAVAFAVHAATLSEVDDARARLCAGIASGLAASGGPEWLARVGPVVASVRSLWRNDRVGAAMAELHRAHLAGVECADDARAADNRVLHAVHRFAVGAQLGEVADDLEAIWHDLPAAALAGHDFSAGGPTRGDSAGDGFAAARAVVRSLDESVSRLRGVPGAGAPPVSGDMLPVNRDDAAAEGYAGLAVSLSRLVAGFLLGDHDLATHAVTPPDADAPASLLAAEAGFYSALALSRRYDVADPARRPDLLRRLNDWQLRLDELAVQGLAGFGAKALLVSAERARLSGDPEQAMPQYERAIDAAREQGVGHVEAIAAELGGRYALARDELGGAVAFLRRARVCYDRWGAKAKVSQLDALLSTTAPVDGARPLDQLDLLAVVRAFQAIHAELDLDRLVVNLLRLFTSHAGARRGALVLTGAGMPPVRAVAQAGRDGVKIYTEPAGASAENTAVRAEPATLVRPIARDGVTLAVLHLEHAPPRVFTAEYLEVLEVLCAQAAVALHNADVHAGLVVANRLLDTAFELRGAATEPVGCTLRVTVDGQSRAVAASAVPVRDGDGTLVGVTVRLD